MTATTLRRRFAVTAGVTAVLLLLLTGVVVAAFVEVGRHQRQVTGTFFNAVRDSTALLNAFLDQETGIRGYALTGEDASLEPYRAGRAEAARQSVVLDGLLRGLPGLRSRLHEVEAAGRAWQDGFAEPLVVSVRAGGPMQGAQAGTDGGRQLFDRVRAAHARFEQEVLAARNDQVNQVEAGRRLLVAAFGTLALLVVLAGTAVGITLRRWILVPLDAVGQDVRAVAEGDLDRAVVSTGPPELRLLGQDVEAMRQRIVLEYRSAQEAGRTVERQRQRLEQQTEDLRRSNAELEQFAYVASHDLQEPLRKIASFTDLLRRRYRGQLDERADAYIDFAVDGARRMQSLINDLLEFSRVGRVGTSWGEAPLADAVATALDTLSDLVDQTGATVEVGDLPVVPGDAGLLTQVFQNLLGNALKFRRPDTVPVVRISAELVDDVWRVDVRDNGIGIDAAYSDRIFVIFTRLNRREDFPGSGIGLALCKKIVEYHGGRIGLGEHEGPGTTISFTLPATGGRAGTESGVEDE